MNNIFQMVKRTKIFLCTLLLILIVFMFSKNNELESTQVLIMFGIFIVIILAWMIIDIIDSFNYSISCLIKREQMVLAYYIEKRLKEADMIKNIKTKEEVADELINVSRNFIIK